MPPEPRPRNAAIELSNMANTFLTTARRVADYMAAQHGIERTPSEWMLFFHELILNYRLHHPAEAAWKSNAAVWAILYEELFRNRY